jgi:hypothetical protein
MSQVMKPPTSRRAKMMPTIKMGLKLRLAGAAALIGDEGVLAMAGTAVATSSLLAIG